MPTNSTLVSKKLNIWQNLADMGWTYNNKVNEPIVDTSNPTNNLTIGSTWELSALISNYKSHISSSQLSKSELRRKSYRRSTWSLFYSFLWVIIYRPSQIFQRLNLNDAYTYIGMFNTWSNLNKTRVCLEYVIYNKHCHIPLKCRSTIKEGDYIMPTYHMAISLLNHNHKCISLYIRMAHHMQGPTTQVNPFSANNMVIRWTITWSKTQPRRQPQLPKVVYTILRHVFPTIALLSKLKN